MATRVGAAREGSGVPVVGFKGASDGVFNEVIGDETWGSLRVCLLVWDTATGAWVRMTQPLIDAAGSVLNLAVDNIEQYILDTLAHYRMVDYTIVSGVIYTGYLAKDGAWYVEAYTIATGNSLFIKGASSYTFASPATLTPYASFSATF